MQTLILEQPGRWSIAQTESPKRPGADEALVRVHRVGVCGTDIHAFRGKQPFFEYPRVLGHELGVEVLEVGADVQNVAPGDRCAVEPYLNCGACIACRRGRENCCANLQVLGVHTDGGMREQIVVPARKLHRSDTLSLEQLALVETLGIGAHAVFRAQIERGERVLVIGAGPIGLGVTQFALQSGAEVTVLDVSAERLQFCREQLGVQNTVKATDAEKTLQTLRDFSGGELFSAVFDATGNAASMQRAFDFVAFGGRLIFVGLFPGDVSFYDPDFHRREMTILASRNALPADFKRIISLVESGEIDTNPWITHRAPLADVPAVFDSWLDPQSRTLKAVIEVS